MCFGALCRETSSELLCLRSAAASPGVDGRRNPRRCVLPESLSKALSRAVCFRSACAFCSASSCKRRAQRFPAAGEAAHPADARSSQGSVTPVFSGLAVSQCKVSILTSYFRRGISVFRFGDVPWPQPSFSIHCSQVSTHLPFPLTQPWDSQSCDLQVSCAGAESAQLTAVFLSVALLGRRGTAAPGALFYFKQWRCHNEGFLKSADEWSIPQPALPAPSRQERSGAECTLNGISYFVKLAACKNQVRAGQLQEKKIHLPIK